MYNITGVVTDGTPGHGPAIGGQPPARTGFQAEDGGIIVPPKGGVPMEYLIVLVILLIVVDSVLHNKKR